TDSFTAAVAAEVASRLVPPRSQVQEA
ncbi:MAG: hypothetical protein QOE66_1455, partial [Chloroflexota bacterium]|nr:hypothetical protein [Chloroflexota bacterium]